jgi:hypothetical protein
MVARKTVCLRRLGGNRGGELQAGRFFANPKVTAAKIVEGWSQLTGAAVAGLHVLAIQDTTEVKFPTTAQRRRGLGPVKKGNTYGVVAHAMIAVDAESHACLGLVGGDVRTRDGVVTEHHRDRPLSERESRRWTETAERAKNVLASAAMVTPAFAGAGSGGRPRKRYLPGMGERAAAGLSSAEPGDGGQAVGWRRQAVQRRQELRGGRDTRDRPSGPAAGSGRAHRHGGDAIWRGRNPPPA